jgi:hypothetical protein
MTHPNYPYFAYDIDAWSYVERAQKQLQLFDAGNPESLFYAAFELRTGIEARFDKGLRALLQTNLKEEEQKYHTQKIRLYQGLQGIMAQRPNPESWRCLCPAMKRSPNGPGVYGP